MNYYPQFLSLDGHWYFFHPPRKTGPQTRVEAVDYISMVRKPHMRYRITSR